MPAQAFLHIYTLSDYAVRLGCSDSSIGKVVLNAARTLSKAHVKIAADPRLSTDALIQRHEGIRE